MEPAGRLPAAFSPQRGQAQAPYRADSSSNAVKSATVSCFGWKRPGVRRVAGMMWRKDVCITEWHFYRVHTGCQRHAESPPSAFSHARAWRGLPGGPVSSRVSGSQEVGGALRRDPIWTTRCTISGILLILASAVTACVWQ